MPTIRLRLEPVFQHLDEVGREHANRSRVTSQPSHPPKAVARVQRFDQVAFDKAQVAFRLAAPRVCCPDPAGESRGEIRRGAHGVEV
jgi:hypothetical protein